MKYLATLSLIGLLVVMGCGRVSEDGNNQTSAQSMSLKQSAAQDTNDSSPFVPFNVYQNKGSRDNHYIPSGFMPDGKCLTFNDVWRENCHSGSTCIKIDYDVVCSSQGQKWAGIYWQNPANNWGNLKGGFDLTGASKLTFWARGERGGERVEEFKIGGVLGDYPDTDTAVIGPVILTDQWKQYSIDLRGKDLSYISGGFSWATNVDVNPQDCTFYLDDIRYE